MKSKFFVVAAIFAFALVIGGISKAYADPYDISEDIIRDVAHPELEVIQNGVPFDHVDLIDSSDSIHEGISDDVILDAEHPEFEDLRRVLPPYEFQRILSIIDSDEDGVKDLYDNCPVDANELQEDFDEDGRGDVCDDSDDDGLFDDEDACPDVFANTANGCPLEESSGLVVTGGGIPQASGEGKEDDGDGDGSEDIEGMGGACSLVQNAGASNALPLIVLALSLVPITIRRSKVSK